MAAIHRRQFLASVLPGAVVAVAGVTVITAAGSSVASPVHIAAMPPAPGQARGSKIGDMAERAPTDVSAQYWRRQRRRYWRRRRRQIRRCWWRYGRRRCAWVWV